MIWHPLILSILICDTFVFLLLLLSMQSLFKVILYWNPEDSSLRQLALEPRFEVASIQNILAFFLFCFSTLLLIFAISSVLPAAIPGAMCGTGVMEAMGDPGIRALITRVLSLTLFFICYQFFMIMRSTPRGGFQTIVAKILILVFPILLLSIYETLQAFWSINISSPVDCCAALYNTMKSSSPIPAFNVSNWPVWMSKWSSPALSVLLIIAALVIKRKQWLIIPVALTWVVASYALLINHLLPYHYGVLQHSCPWCVFGADTGFLGFPIFFFMLAVTWTSLKKALLAWIALRTSAAGIETSDFENSAPKPKAAGIMLSIILFYIFSGWPALAWYVSRGTWIQ